MHISRLVEKIFIRLCLIVILFPLQSCSNTVVGEKLKNSFDTIENSKNVGKTSINPKKINQKIKIKSRIKDTGKENETDYIDVVKENLTSNKDRLTQKSQKKIVFNPRPYRIILRLSGANPSAPAETVTEALRKAGVQFEVEKIERFNEDKFSKDTFLKR